VQIYIAHYQNISNALGRRLTGVSGLFRRPACNDASTR